MRSNSPAITSETLESIGQKVFSIVRFNECGLVVNFVGDHYYTIPQILNDKNLLKKILGRSYGNYLLSYIELTSESGLEQLRQAMLKICSSRKINVSYKNTAELGYLIDILVTQGYEVAFFISYIDSFFTKKHELMTLLESLARNHRVSLVYFSELNLTNSIFKEQQKDYPAMFQNLIMLPIYGEEDTQHFISYNEKLWNIVIPTAFKKKIMQECGGNLWLLRQAMRYIRNTKCANEKDLFSHYELLQKASVTLSQLFEDELEIVKKIIQQNKLIPSYSPALQYLLKINLLKKKPGGYVLTIPLLKRVLEQKQMISDLRVKNNLIYLGEEMISALLTEKEESILRYFLGRKNTLLARGDIAKIIWKNVDGYSDWALDQIMSRLRSKLISYGLPRSIIKTKKGAGYVFSY